MITICHQSIILVSVTKCPQMKLHQLEEMSNHLSNKSQEVKDHFYFKLKIRHILEIIRRIQIIRWPMFYDIMIFNSHSHIIIEPWHLFTVSLWITLVIQNRKAQDQIFQYRNPPPSSERPPPPSYHSAVNQSNRRLLPGQPKRGKLVLNQRPSRGEFTLVYSYRYRKSMLC